MSLIAKSKGGADFKPVPAGTHVAVCTMVIDMGIQPSDRFKPKHQVYVRWEIPSEIVTWKDSEGVEHTGPAVIGKKYTLSLSDKANLRADLESWRGRMFSEQELAGFDISNILGKGCMLGVTHNKGGDKVYASVSAVMGLAKGTAAPNPVGPLLSYDIDDHDPEIFEKLPGWLQEAIKGRVANEKATSAQGNGSNEFDDEIPF